MTKQREVVDGLLDPQHLVRVAGILDIDPAPLLRIGELPPFWHVGLLPTPTRTSDLGADGHRLHGVPTPPAPHLTRMFAGGRVTNLRPLRLGTATTREARVSGSVDRNGRSGPLTFVTVTIEFRQGRDLCVVEEQDIVYRPPSSRSVPSQPAAAPGRGGFASDPVRLFLFSALTANAHRIHYDREFAHGEGYPGLVVHGPLQALLLAEAFRTNAVDFTGATFSYKLVAPAFENAPLTAYVNGKNAELRDGERVTALASIQRVGER